jgi:anti-sigma regulatory factor (Ser/Thr protein kinase)
VEGVDDQVGATAEERDGMLRDGHSDDAASRSASGRPQPFAQPLPAPACEVRELVFAGEQLGVLRRTLTNWAAEQRMPQAPTEELVLAVNELATNSVRHGGGAGKLLLWRESDRLVCEIRDAGHIDDALIGRSRPAPNQHTGRGLWLVHQLCDLVEIHSSPTGTAVRVHKRAAEQNGGSGG